MPEVDLLKLTKQTFFSVIFADNNGIIAKHYEPVACSGKNILIFQYELTQNVPHRLTVSYEALQLITIIQITILNNCFINVRKEVRRAHLKSLLVYE